MDEGQRDRRQRRDAVKTQQAVLPEGPFDGRNPGGDDELGTEHHIGHGAERQPAETHRGQPGRGGMQQQRGDHQHRIENI